MLHFIFKDGDNIIYDEKCDFKKIDNKIEFFCNNECFVIELGDNNFNLSKTNDDSIFTLQKVNEKNHSSIHLIDKNIDFILQVNDLKYKNDNDYILISYVLESDEKSVKILEIRY